MPRLRFLLAVLLCGGLVTPAAAAARPKALKASAAKPALTAKQPKRTAGRSTPVPVAVPLPRARPRPAATPADPGTAHSDERRRTPPRADAGDGCPSRLHALLAETTPEPAISGPGQCGASDLVRLMALQLPDGGRVQIQPPAKLRCGMAEALVTWLRDQVAPAVEQAGAKLAGVAVDTSYECRPRNHQAGAKLSEHATGNAVDIRELRLANGKSVALTDASVFHDVRSTLARSACAQFTTVLGPGSDPQHANHIHLDVLQRRAGYRICQWDVR